MSVTWKSSGVKHRLDYDSDTDQNHARTGRTVVTACGLVGWADVGWSFTRIRRPREDDRLCERCYAEAGGGR